MHVLIIGAGGMIGARLARLLARRGTLGGVPIDRLTLADITTPAAPGFAGPLATLALDMAAPGAAARLIADRPDVIFHLAAIVSSQAEADFDLGYATNLDGTRALLDAIRAANYCPRLVFASSTAVFGAPFPTRIPDDFHATPRSSYGTQKAMTELLLNDHSRRGHVDAVALRLPTICIRPGRPNAAASGFYSNILREPLAGKPANLPVPETTRHWFASPASAIAFFDHAATLDLARIGPNRAINMPGLSATVADQIDALRREAGQDSVNLITRIPDPVIAAIVNTWPQDFDTARADALGFTADSSFDAIIAAHLAVSAA
jgi:nucleoside-diphosphate-sugar epimerase